MKKTLLVLWVLIALSWAPSAASAQGLPPGSPGVPDEFPADETWGRVSSPGPRTPAGPGPGGGLLAPAAPGEPPAAQMPAPAVCLKPPGTYGTAYAGYAFDLGKGFRYVREGGLGNGNADLGHKAPCRGAWLGLGLTSPLTCGPGYRIIMGFLIPGTTRGDLYQNENAPIQVTGDLSSHNQWWYVDGAGTYTVYGDPCEGLFEVVGGLKWDYFKASQDIVASDDGASGTLDVSATNNLTVSAWLPYLGLQYRMLSQDSRVLGRAVGFPWLWGQVTFNDTFAGTRQQGDFQGSGNFSESLKNGYFIELFGEYARTVWGSVEAGAFIKADFIHAQSQTGTYTSSVDGPRPEQITYDRRSLTVGGLISLTFNLF